MTRVSKIIRTRETDTGARWPINYHTECLKDFTAQNGENAAGLQAPSWADTRCHEKCESGHEWDPSKGNLGTDPAKQTHTTDIKIDRHGIPKQSEP
jgi:hypothetical protein